MFIEFLHESGRNILINLNQVVNIQPHRNDFGKTVITYNHEGFPSKRFDIVMETYDQVKEKVWTV